MDKTLAWLWLADAVGSACQNARDLLALYPDPETLYDALHAGREAPPYFLSDHAAAQLARLIAEQSQLFFDKLNRLRQVRADLRRAVDRSPVLDDLVFHFDGLRQ